MVVENYCSRIKIKIDIQVGGFFSVYSGFLHQ